MTPRMSTIFLADAFYDTTHPERRRLQHRMQPRRVEAATHERHVRQRVQVAQHADAAAEPIFQSKAKFAQ